MTITQIDNPSILIKPSIKLSAYIKTLQVDETTSPGVAAINKNKSLEGRHPAEHKYLVTETDRSFLNGLELVEATPAAATLDFVDDHSLNLQDVYWLHDKIKSDDDTKVYFHELFEGSEVVLPKNAEVPRNPELEKRCKILKAQQQNRRYKAMTKNVDCVRQRHPEDTIAYQMKQLNRHLIAVGQFIVSVAAGFAFGFIGVELLVGSLDFGFRILLGIICALVIALAELYFLAKKLNEDLNFETRLQDDTKSSKIN